MQSKKANRFVESRPQNLIRTISGQSSNASTNNFNHLDGQFMKIDYEMGPETINMEYKDYTYPWDARKKNTITECICSFLNTQGGTILIGIKETQQVKRIVRGIHYSEKQIEQLKKDVTRIVQNISRMAVAANLVSVKLVPVVDPHMRKRKQLYVVKIEVKKGWLENHRNLYHFVGNFFFRTQNEVKQYNEKSDLQEIRKWRLETMLSEKKKQQERQQNIERFLLQRSWQVSKPKMKEQSIQTDPQSIPRNKIIRSESSEQGMKVSLMSRSEGQDSVRKGKKSCVLEGISRLWKKFTGICQ